MFNRFVYSGSIPCCVLFRQWLYPVYLYLIRKVPACLFIFLIISKRHLFSYEFYMILFHIRIVGIYWHYNKHIGQLWVFMVVALQVELWHADRSVWVYLTLLIRILISLTSLHNPFTVFKMMYNYIACCYVEQSTALHFCFQFNFQYKEKKTFHFKLLLIQPSYKKKKKTNLFLGTSICFSMVFWVCYYIISQNGQCHLSQFPSTKLQIFHKCYENE